MDKSPDAFRTISEVAEWLDVPAHVLRFWESRFTQVKPVKRAGGRRYYRPNDMLLLGGIKQMLHVDGMTIRGAQKVLREQGIKHVTALSQPLQGDLTDAMADEADLVPEAPMAEDVAPAPVEDNVVALKPAPTETPPTPQPAAANADTDTAPATPETSQHVEADPQPELDFAAESELQPAPAKRAPLGIRVPQGDPDDEDLAQVDPPLLVRLRHRETRHLLRDNHAPALATALARLRALSARMSDGA